jgi:hypothetical protein
MTVKLTDAQLVMMSAAAQREDHCLIASNTMKGAVLTKVGEKLVGLGLVREVRATAKMPVWRRDDAASFALKLTAAGLKAIAVDDDEATATRDAPPPQPDPDANKALGPGATRERAKSTPRADSKLARVIDQLKRSDGATIAHLIEVTGWLPHTTRAALTGLRKRGFAVVRQRIDGGDSVYRIAGTAADAGDRSLVESGSFEVRNREVKPKANQAA